MQGQEFRERPLEVFLAVKCIGVLVLGRRQAIATDQLGYSKEGFATCEPSFLAHIVQERQSSLERFIAIRADCRRSEQGSNCRNSCTHLHDR